MNTQNYASLEASKRLHDAGIILETDAVWEGKEGQTRLNLKANCPDGFPAPSMAEVWRELPEEYCKNASDPIRYKVLMSSQVGYHSGGKDGGIWIPYKGNPADALIDLLIWKEKP